MGDRDRLANALVAGRFRLKRRLGAGSMGVVYEGENLLLGSRVAIKLLTNDPAEYPELAARFRREAKAAAAAESDYIVKIIDAGQDPELGMYMVTEFLVGEDLEVCLRRERRLDAAEAAGIAYQVARGLSKAHRAGVIHRDLKPANIFLVESEEGGIVAKILDFGVSKYRLGEEQRDGKGDQASLTAAGVALGTPQFMSPEQVRGADDIDARSDVWALSAVLYEMLSGRPAFPAGVSAIDIMLRILRGPPEPLEKIAPWVAPALAEVVRGGLEPNRDKRIPDAVTFAQRLADALPEGSPFYANDFMSSRVMPVAVRIEPDYESLATIPCAPPSDAIPEVSFDEAIEAPPESTIDLPIDVDLSPRSNE